MHILHCLAFGRLFHKPARGSCLHDPQYMAQREGCMTKSQILHGHPVICVYSIVYLFIFSNFGKRLSLGFTRSTRHVINRDFFKWLIEWYPKNDPNKKRRFFLHLGPKWACWQAAVGKNTTQTRLQGVKILKGIHRLQSWHMFLFPQNRKNHHRLDLWIYYALAGGIYRHHMG